MEVTVVEGLILVAVLFLVVMAIRSGLLSRRLADFLKKRGTPEVLCVVLLAVVNALLQEVARLGREAVRKRLHLTEEQMDKVLEHLQAIVDILEEAQSSSRLRHFPL